MRRGLRGATTAPPHRRPGNGIGRPLRPGPAPERRLPTVEDPVEVLLERVLAETGAGPEG